MKHEITFEIFGKTIKSKVEANTKQEAIEKMYKSILNKVKIIEHKKSGSQIEPNLDAIFQNFKDIFNGKK